MADDLETEIEDDMETERPCVEILEAGIGTRTKADFLSTEDKLYGSFPKRGPEPLSRDRKFWGKPHMSCSLNS